MEPRTLQYLANACGGQLVNCRQDALFTAVVTDSRKITPGVLFWSIAGERHDGHEFAAGAIGAGAVAAVAAQAKLALVPKNLPMVAVNDTRAALAQFASRYRGDFSPAVIAVAGSNGKTTVKDALQAALSEVMETVASEESFNNEIGLPQTLLRIEEKHRAAVVEIGSNHPGELAPLIRVARPKFGVITSIAREHLEFFGDIAGVAREEGALAEMLPKEGALFINGDAPEIESILRRAECRVVTVGAGERNQWRVASISPDETGVRFGLTGPDGAWSGEWSIPLLGRHQAINAALAIAVAQELGGTPAEAQRGLQRCRPAKMRMQLEHIGGATVLNDAYNANADSMGAALNTLAEYPARGRRIAILGEMAELGETADAAHREVGKLAGELGIDHVVAIGRHSIWTADSARAAGAGDASSFSDCGMAAAAVLHLVRPGDVVLAKASRASRLERVVEALRKAQAALNPAGAGA